eukprot:gnl/MRDRNA2_/MRDRNA2_61885_c0_seq1.p1 gnl/MRDRNA2_/MRDRNA2_61885_c0~~gnl/MRDRNA2_/MRDRNA2_61885_c0_seq1.p1  ORF type:complete len:2062 (+),score=342.33 gnl/MRDRNA2_/MRDRNA2_61885_c0_seq1:111-6188(+)
MDLANSTLVGRMVRRGVVLQVGGAEATVAPASGDPSRSAGLSYIVPASRLESTLSSFPLNFSAEEASALVSRVGQACYDAADRIDVLAFAKLFEESPPVPSSVSSKVSQYWIEQIHYQLHAVFDGSADAFDYLDHAGHGAVDLTHFVDGVLRAVQGSLPLRSQSSGVQVLDTTSGTGGAASVSSQEITVPGISRFPPSKAGRFVPDSYIPRLTIDDLQQRECSVACQELFRGLTTSYHGSTRQLRLLAYKDFDRFWREGVWALPSAEKEAPFPTYSKLSDFWANQLMAAVVACGDEILTAVTAISGEGTSGQVHGRDLISLIAWYLTMRFAPLMLSSENEPLTSVANRTLGHCTSLSALDLSTPLAVLLHGHAQRLLHRGFRHPLAPVSLPLGAAPGDITGHWQVESKLFVDYCKQAAVLDKNKNPGATEGFEVGISDSVQLDDDAACRTFKEVTIFTSIINAIFLKATATSALQPLSRGEMYGAMFAMQCFIGRFQKSIALLRDLKTLVLEHNVQRIVRFQQNQLGCMPSPDSVSAAERKKAADSLSTYLNMLRRFLLEDLHVEFNEVRSVDLNRKIYDGAHPIRVTIIVETVKHEVIAGRLQQEGRFHHVEFCLGGDEKVGIVIDQVLEGPDTLHKVANERWLLLKQKKDPAAFVAELRPDDTLVFQGPFSTRVVVEVVPKIHVTEAISVEAAIHALVGGRCCEEFNLLLRPEERSAEWGLDKARPLNFLGWWYRGDYLLAKEYWSKEEWVPLQDALNAAGGLSRDWLVGGSDFFRLLCRQILGLLLLLHKHNICSRYLRLKDILISTDGKQLRIQSFRFASFMLRSPGAPVAGSSSKSTLLPSLRGVKDAPLAPEFFAKDPNQTTTPHVDAWVFGALAFELFFGAPPPTFQSQLGEYYDRHSNVKWPGPRSFRIPQDLPRHFSYDCFANVAVEYRVLLRDALNHQSKLRPPPRVVAGIQLMSASSLSFSGMSPRPPVQYAKAGEPGSGTQADAGRGVRFIPEGADGLKSMGPESENLVDSEEEKPKSSSTGGKQQKQNEPSKAENVTVPEGQVLDLIFLCLLVDPKQRPSIKQLFVSPVFNVEDSRDTQVGRQWYGAVFRKQLWSYADSWVKRGFTSRAESVEHALRVMAAYLFTRNELSESQQSEYMYTLEQIENVILTGSVAVIGYVFDLYLLQLLLFSALRTKTRNPLLLERFFHMMRRVLSYASSPKANFGTNHTHVIDLVICCICGSEFPLTMKARHKTQFFMRPAGWQAREDSQDQVDAQWRHHGIEQKHFGKQTYLLFNSLLNQLVSEERDVTKDDKPQSKPIQVVLEKRTVRGRRYIMTLMQVAENHYRFCQGTSPVAQRSAVMHSQSILRTMNEEQMLPLIDLEIPAAYLTLLGSSDESIVHEVCSFYEQIHQVLTPPGQHCLNGLDCPACSGFLRHYSPRGIHLFASITMSPSLNDEVKKSAVRVLAEVAMAPGLPPQRQALGMLVQLLQVRRPMDDPLTTTLQPYVRRLLTELVQSPTPAFVHAMFCFPSIFTHLRIANTDILQPDSLDLVSERADKWMQRARELQKQRGGQPNWLSIIPLASWVRHLARMHSIPALLRAMQSLHEVYKEAFIHAEMPHFPQPTDAGGLPPSGFVDDSKAVDAKLPRRFMNEYLAVVEFVFQRFGPGPIVPVLHTFATELQSERLMETSWFFQLLQFFGTMTSQTAPWIEAKKGKSGLKSSSDGGVSLLHPSKWSLGKWFGELHRVDFARIFLRVLRSAFTVSKAVLRRPVWTETLVTLLRKIWKNMLSVPSGNVVAVDGAGASGDIMEPSPDAVIMELVDAGVMRFLLVDCISNIANASLTGVEADADAKGSALMGLRDTAVTFLEDAVAARHHLKLVMSIVEQLTRQYIDSQVVHFFSPHPSLRKSAMRLFQAVASINMPEVDTLLRHSDVYPYLQAEGHGEGGGMASSSKAVVQDASHPLSLHRIQVGELSAGSVIHAATSFSADTAAASAKAAVPKRKAELPSLRSSSSKLLVQMRPAAKRSASTTR